MSASTSSAAHMRPGATATLPLHRVRFFDHTPSPITALAFAPTPLPPAADPSAKGKGRVGGTQAANASANQGGASGKAELGVLVLARDNGDVEVWQWVEPEVDGQGNWVLEKVLPPTLTHPGVSLMCLVIRNPTDFQHKPYRVPRLADLRLYTAGSDSSDITERCLFTGRVLQTYTIPSPPLWAMSVSPTHQYLCLATTSPNLHFLSITPFGLEPPPAHLLRSDALPSRTRTVSIAWGPPRCVKAADTLLPGTGTDGRWEWRDTYLITGNSDSSFRKFDLPGPADPSRPGSIGRVTLSGRSVVEKQSKGQGAKKGNGKGTIVWGVAVLPDHTVVTADSLGSVGFWDGASLAQKQTFRAHKADAMCMTVGPSGRSVFTSGPDQRICQFVKVDGGSKGDWALTSTKRAHAHDVRALACLPAYVPCPETSIAALNSSASSATTIAPVLASGGWDMSLVLTPCASPDASTSSSSSALTRVRNPLGRFTSPNTTRAKVLFEEAYPRKMGYLAGARSTGRISVSRSARLVLGRKERSVGLWKVHADEQGWDKLLDMDFRLRTALTCAVLSEDGRWMAVSDLYETKLFALRPSASGTGSVAPKRIKSFLPTLLESEMLEHLNLESKGTGASSLLFTPDSARLIVGLAMSGQVLVLELNGHEAAKGQEVRVAQVFKRDDATLGSGGRVIAPAPGQGGAGRKARRRANKHASAATPPATEEANGDSGMDVDGGEDLGEADGDADEAADESQDEEEGQGYSGDDGQIVQEVGEKQGRVANMAVSADGQWLAVSDLLGKVSILNLDTLRPHATLPSFPSSPIALLSPPTHPSLFAIVLPSASIVFYDAESRALLQPTAQISKLNKALGDQFNPISGASFEPSPASASASASAPASPFDSFSGLSGLGGAIAATAHATTKADARNVKILLWSNDWVCSARLDLEMVAKEGQRRRRGGSSLSVLSNHAQTNGPSAATDSAGHANGNGSGNGGLHVDAVNGTAPANAATAGLSKRANRRKRAREAREARDAVERSSVSLSVASSPSASVSVSASAPASLVNGTSAVPPSPLGAGLRLTSSVLNGNGEAPASPLSATATTPALSNRQQHAVSSASDPDFYRFTHDAFRSLAAVEWLGAGEMMVVERPMGDFVADLPPAFFVGTYGRG